MAYTTIISSHELAANLNNQNWVIFDCRFSLADSEAGAKAYRFGHIANARYVNLNNDLSSTVQDYTGRHPLPNFSLLAQKLGAWGVNNSTQVIVYDDASGAFAGRMWWLLRYLGHYNVAVLDGGLQHWQKAGYSQTTTLPQITGTNFRAYLDNSHWLSAQQIENGLARQNVTVIDARTEERYHGHQEPIDPVAGHIPKALNRPFQNNLDKQGRFLPTKELRKQFVQLTKDSAPDRVVHMCGSGVTACHNLLAMEIAGLSGSKLYAGSWSEWIRNKNRPVTKLSQ